jgi:hypothetical protein
MKVEVSLLDTRRKILHVFLLFVMLSVFTPVPIIQSRPYATDVGGPIISDTTWTLANSPYVVIANVEVWEGVTLTIEPGVEVRFNSGYNLQVNGTLVARGTPAQPILFTSNQANPQSGDWNGILFADTSVDANFDSAGNYLSGSILQYCVVEYVKYRYAMGAIDAPQAAPFADHCTVRNNDSMGINITGSPGKLAKITYNTVSNNLDRGINASYSVISNNVANSNSGRGIYALQSTITDNIVTGNSAVRGGGIYAYGSIVSDNTVSGNNDLSSSWYLGYGGGILADESTISNNTVNGNSAERGGGIEAANSIVSNNIVSNNSAMTIGVDACGGGISVFGSSTVVGNTVSGNSVTGYYATGGGICAYGDTYTAIMSNTVVSNAVDGTEPGAGAGVYLYGPVDFIGNTIVGNIGPATHILGGVGINGRSQFHYNNLYDNSPFDVVIQSSYDISGTLNYWGTTSSVNILNQVYDWYDNSSRGRLLYIPYLQDPSPDAPVPPPLNLAAGVSGDSVTLVWDAIPSATTGYGYKIYYGANSDPPYEGTGFDQGDSPIDAGNLTAYTLTGLTPGQIYHFAVTAYDTQGRESWYSNVVSPFHPPVPPSNPRATPVDFSHIRLEWRDKSNDETGFQIYDGEGFVTVGANSTSYIAGGLDPNSYHCYTVRAFNGFGYSAWTAWACATTLAAPNVGIQVQPNGNFFSKDEPGAPIPVEGQSRAFFPYRVRVTGDGTPLEGASVRLVAPFDEFLGTTNAGGIVEGSIAVPTPPQAGGFSVEVEASVDTLTVSSGPTGLYTVQPIVNGRAGPLTASEAVVYNLGLLTLYDIRPGVPCPNLPLHLRLVCLARTLLDFIVGVNQGTLWQVQEGDVAGIRAYSYSTAGLPSVYVHYQTVERGGTLVYSSTLWTEQPPPSGFPRLARRALVMELASPATLYITDPTGKSAGTDPTSGTLMFDFPLAISDAGDEPYLAVVPDPMDGQYTVLVVGTEIGPYTLTVYALGDDGMPTELLEVTGTTEPGQTAEYEINYPANRYIYLPIILKNR